MDTDQLIAAILDFEWPMFLDVNGSGPKASCQLDGGKFRRMRACQYRAWSDTHLASWLADLREAQSLGRNLPAEKYARMMAQTHPAEYAALEPDLPPVDAASLERIEEIVRINLRWKEELDANYPALMSRGRRSRGANDAADGNVSFETYFRSELMTCSAATIAVYHSDTLQRLAENRSEARENLLNQVREAGFASLESANARYAGA